MKDLRIPDHLYVIDTRKDGRGYLPFRRKLKRAFRRRGFRIITR